MVAGPTPVRSTVPAPGRRRRRPPAETCCRSSGTFQDIDEVLGNRLGGGLGHGVGHVAKAAVEVDGDCVGGGVHREGQDGEAGHGVVSRGS